jgi:hypothetical protein
VFERRDRGFFDFSKEGFGRIVHRVFLRPSLAWSRDSRLLNLKVASQTQLASQPATPEARPFYSIADLADRWRCSRASVYNRIRGERVVDFAASGRKGHKLVPLEIILKIERTHLRVLR